MDHLSRSLQVYRLQISRLAEDGPTLELAEALEAAADGFRELAGDVRLAATAEDVSVRRV